MFDKRRRTPIVAAKPFVPGSSIGNRPPTDHYVEGFADPVKRFVHKEELYQPKQRDRRG